MLQAIIRAGMKLYLSNTGCEVLLRYVTEVWQRLKIVIGALAVLFHIATQCSLLVNIEM